MKTHNHSQVQTSPEPMMHLTARGKIVAGVLAGLAVFGAVEATTQGVGAVKSVSHSVDHYFKDHDGNVYTTNQLDSFPKQQITPYSGESDEQIVEEVNPQLARRENWPALADEMNYVDKQGGYRGETVQVPIIPDHK